MNAIKVLDFILKNMILKNNQFICFLDDSSDFLLKQKDHFFQIDNYFGISPNDCRKAKTFLNSL